MPSVDTVVMLLAGIAFFAAFVNGAIGYGFSSLTVPLALVFLTNRILNPAVVLIEVFTNFYVLLINLGGVAAVWRKVLPILGGLIPGIAVGAFVLASLQPGWIKFGTYTIILPLILLQAAGWRRPIRATWLVGLPFGTALGVLYSVTTISGPPLAILFNNQGLVKTEFRAGLALVRVVESSVTAIVYYHLGLFTAESQNLLVVFIPSVVIGIPLGTYLIRRLDAETFRRICMSFDAWVVGFGLSRVLIELNFMKSPWAYSAMAATILIDAWLLYVFFTVWRTSPNGLQSQRAPVTRLRADNWLRESIRSRVIDLTHPLHDLVGYAVAFAAFAMLAYTVFPALRSPQNVERREPIAAPLTQGERSGVSTDRTRSPR